MFSLRLAQDILRVNKILKKSWKSEERKKEKKKDNKKTSMTQNDFSNEILRMRCSRIKRSKEMDVKCIEFRKFRENCLTDCENGDG